MSPTDRRRVLVAMSGGVDSSVAAAMMLEAGHDVIGVTLKQWEGRNGELPTAGCCTLSDAEDARRVCGTLGIPYYVLDYVDEFRDEVVQRFGTQYLRGLTPNPCLDCNRRVRFRTLLERAEALDCSALVTGHHARVCRDEAGYHLLAGRDQAKDQSYVLHMLRQQELGRVLLPIGEITKDEVRAIAADLGLRNAAKPDSQDICFVGDGDYRDFLRREFPATARPGDLVDTSGNVVGRHEGIAGFTVGQRKGLGIAAAEPRYVIRVDAGANRVVVGRRADLGVAGIDLDEVSFVGAALESGAAVEVKVRYRGTAEPATLLADGGTWMVRFGEPVPAVAPGQAAVFYRGDEVLGGGTITATRAA